MLTVATSIKFDLDCVDEELIQEAQRRIHLIIFLIVQSTVQMKSDLSNEMKALHIRGIWSTKSSIIVFGARADHRKM